MLSLLLSSHDSHRISSAHAGGVTRGQDAAETIDALSTGSVAIICQPVSGTRVEYSVSLVKVQLDVTKAEMAIYS